MSNRVILSPTEVLLSSDVLKSNKYPYVGIGRLAQAVLGSTTQLNGLPCTPTAPASLAVLVGSGEIYIQEPTDPTAYGVLPIDNTLIVKQGILESPTSLPTPAPAGVGNSVNYLIQVGFSETDTGSTLRQFYNSADPKAPIFETVNTERKDSAIVQAKSGAPAPTGTQTTPAPDAGFVGAYVVTVANGQTSVNSGDITVYSGAPFISSKLKDKMSQTEADARYAQISQFITLLSTNGYYKFPFGLIVQWGTLNIAAPGSVQQVTGSITFPIPFLSEVFGVFPNIKASPNSNEYQDTSCYAFNLTGANIRANCTLFDATTPFDINWLAIGH